VFTPGGELIGSISTDEGRIQLELGAGRLPLPRLVDQNMRVKAKAKS